MRSPKMVWRESLDGDETIIRRDQAPLFGKASGEHNDRLKPVINGNYPFRRHSDLAPPLTLDRHLPNDTGERIWDRGGPTEPNQILPLATTARRRSASISEGLPPKAWAHHEHEKIIVSPRHSQPTLPSLSTFVPRSCGFGNDEEDDARTSLKDQLFHVMVESAYDGHRKFIPEGQVTHLLTEDTVASELRKSAKSFRRRLQDWRVPTKQKTMDISASIICGTSDKSGLRSDWESNRNPTTRMRNDEYRRIFAILVLINRPYRIGGFIRAGICDNDLPLVRSTSDPSRLAIESSPDTPLPCFEGWRSSTIAHFEERQWSVLAPVFRPSDMDHESTRILQRGTILPFTKWCPVPRRGGFGQVYKTRIHPAHDALSETAVSLRFGGSV